MTVLSRRCVFGLYLQLWRSVSRELQLLFADGDIEKDLHRIQTAPGSLTCVHLPQ